MVITDEKQILDFLRGEGPDHVGRLYQETLAFSDREMEQCHDQVQWVFPLAEFSKLAKTYPIINPTLVEKAKKDPIILDNIRNAKDRFEKFFGLGEHEDVDKQRRWCRFDNGRPNHNLLRVTRIIRCLRIFGLTNEASEFYYAACKAADRFGLPKLTLDYWEDAYNSDVWDPLQR